MIDIKQLRKDTNIIKRIKDGNYNKEDKTSI